MTDVLITFDKLLALRTKLDEIVAELEGAGDRSNALESAIARPFGRGELRDAAGDFESRWDDKRVDLARDMSKVRDRTSAVLEGFAKFDKEAAGKLAEASKGA